MNIEEELGEIKSDLREIKCEVREIKSDLREIKTFLNILGKKLDSLKNNVDETIVVDCKKMSDHINFIENVYANVKYPLEYMCTKINYVTGVKPSLAIRD